ncbi:MAG: hypothetical protein GX225_04240 [Clostridiales bacterium]|nr:hypothetical protein [Clostridiales bacterium]
MPHINRVRVNNVKYNFGTQFYDDFLMRFSGKNTIYDLANGGGKSVLMLLLLQNMIPNCTLDEKQPIEKLFRTNSGSNTIHSLIEWKLSDIHIKNNYKYMLTGFCARKARENDESVDGTSKETASIEYFNYCIFYREFNDNDIKNLPLSNGNERITYNGLKAYLRDLEKKDLSLEVKVFERKGDYQRFISGYGLYESEWEIIRGINKTEGHVRTYFESNYKTTRKVVEDLLIEEIIQKSFHNRTLSDSDDEIMAKTLMNIKDKLLELGMRKEDMSNYDRQIEVIEEFAKRVNTVKDLYYGRDDLSEEIIKCYYSVKQLQENQEKEKVEAERQIQILEAEEHTCRHAIETAKVCMEEVEYKEAQRVLQELDSRCQQLKERVDKINEELTLKESVNDYIDYLYYKKERDKLRYLVDNILKDKGDISKEMQILASAKYEKNKIKISEIESEIEKEQRILVMEEALLEELEEKSKECHKEVAVYEYLIKENEKKAAKLGTEISSLKKDIGIVVEFDISKQSQSMIKEMEIAEEAIFGADNALNNMMEGIGINKLKLQHIMEEAADVDQRVSDNIDERTKYAGISDRVEKMMTVYREKDVTRLAEIVNTKYIDMTAEILRQKSELDYKRKTLEALRLGCPIADGEEINNVFEYIERYHGNIAIKGSEYIRSLSAEEKKTVIENNPLVPYSVIIKENYHTLIGDVKLMEQNLAGRIVPIIRLEAVSGNEFVVNNSNISFVMCKEDLFYDEEVIEKEIQKIQEEINGLDFKLEQMEETCNLLKADYNFIDEYASIHMQKIEEAKASYENLKGRRKDLEKQQEELREIIKVAEKETVKWSEELAEQKKVYQSKKIICDNLLKIAALNNEYIAVSDEIVRFKSNLMKVKKEQETIMARLSAEKNQTNERKRYCSIMSDKITQIKDQWDNIYKPHYREDVEGNININEEELEARFMGLLGVIKGESSDVADKQALINNYDIAMEKSLQAIDYKGMLVDDISVLISENKMTEIPKDELKQIKRNIHELKSQLIKYENEESKLRSKKDKMAGSIEHGRNLVMEKYGEFNDMDMESSAFLEFISSNESKIGSLKDKKISLDIMLKRFSDNRQKNAILLRDIEKIITTAHINVGSEERVLEYTGDLEEKIGQIVEKYDKFLKEMYDKKEEFEKEKQMLVDILFKLGAEPLSEEIRQNVTMPESISDADMEIEALEDITRCLELEKDRIAKSIEDMKKIKDNFENQCIQTCINIKTELDRLPKLSKIFMDGETISIISLNIPYVKQEQYKLNMEKYIDETVDVADTLATEAEKVRYIKSQLSFKKLFSVIVTDMNAIKLNLYKRERIKEQSRYLKYEEAVGSTGQSQGIYIQFLISVINYISSINSQNSEGGGLKKVIFIDNPFGAAKDIYIWEPIFKLLKTNNVQLIVPARGTTPAITGRFDVNYILGQKLVDGKQQTVVVDYCSNIDNDQMDYTTLTYEQTALF